MPEGYPDDVLDVRTCSFPSRPGVHVACVQLHILPIIMTHSQLIDTSQPSASLASDVAFASFSLHAGLTVVSGQWMTRQTGSLFTFLFRFCFCFPNSGEREIHGLRFCEVYAEKQSKIICAVRSGMFPAG